MNDVHAEYEKAFQRIADPIFDQLNYECQVEEKLESTHTTVIKIVAPNGEKYEFRFATNHLDYADGVRVYKIIDHVKTPVLPSNQFGQKLYRYMGQNLDDEIRNLVYDFAIISSDGLREGKGLNIHPSTPKETISEMLSLINQGQVLTFYNRSMESPSDPGVFCTVIKNEDGYLLERSNHGWSSQKEPIAANDLVELLLQSADHIDPISHQVVPIKIIDDELTVFNHQGDIDKPSDHIQDAYDSRHGVFGKEKLKIVFGSWMIVLVLTIIFYSIINLF